MLKEFAHKIYIILKALFLKVRDYVVYVFNSWPKAVIGTIVLLCILYYPLGGSMIENIDRTTSYEIKQEDKMSSTIDMMQMLVNRETNKHIWTANLPIFFPSYFMDNMPHFQMGMVKAMSNIAAPISEQIQCPDNAKEGGYIKTAAELLNYPGNVWVFSPDNKLKIAPSSSSQYRKARKRLIDTNDALEKEICFWHKGSQNLSSILDRVEKDLNSIGAVLEKQINEESSSWFDTESDDIFYESQGKLYVYTMLLRTLAQDYKESILANNLYQDWTKAVRSLEMASEVNPQMVRNGELNASFSPNHLVVIAYYAIKAENILININDKLLGED